VDEAWLETVGMPLAMEQSILDFAENVEPRSRLSCQVTVRDEMNGLIVYLPESQH
jgi:2Fe-2S ferredoxin